jgi:hypothetical protein
LLRERLETQGFAGWWTGDEIVLWDYSRLIPRPVFTSFEQWPRRGIRQENATCLAAFAPVVAEPRDDAEQVTQILSGEPITIIRRRDGWARIFTVYDQRGWVRNEAVRAGVEFTWLKGRKGNVLDEARAYLGAPYEWGGMTAQGIDCSGLIHMSFRRLGILVPRDSWQQEEAGVGSSRTRPTARRSRLLRGPHRLLGRSGADPARNRARRRRVRAGGARAA